MTETQEFIQPLSEFYEESDDYESYSIYAPIQVYRGHVERPQWTDVDAGLQTNPCSAY